MHIAVLFTLVLLSIQQTEYGFSGFRVTQLVTDYLADFVIFAEDGFKKTGGTPFTDIVSISGDGTDKQTLTIFDIKYSYFSYNKNEIIGTPTINSKKNFWTLEIDSGIFEYVYTIKWKIEAFGLNLLFGNATISLKSSKVKIEQEFIQGATKTQIYVTWKETITQFFCQNSKGDAAKPWIGKLIVSNFSKALEEKIQQEVPKEVDDDMITNYNQIHMTLEKGMEVAYINTLESMYKYSSGQGDYISLQYNTTITIPNRPFITEMVRTVYPKVAPDHQLEICFNEEIFADTMDTLGKGRYFYQEFENVIFGTELKVANFLPLIPSLVTKYSPQDGVRVGCRPDISERVVDLKIANKPLYMQIPLKCAMAITKTGEEFMSLTVELRANYKPAAYYDGGVYALLENVRVHNYHAPFFYPLHTQMELNEILDRIANFYNNLNVIFPARVLAPLHRPQLYQYKALTTDTTADVICVKYDKYAQKESS
jgi:hypothetical protein